MTQRYKTTIESVETGEDLTLDSALRFGSVINTLLDTIKMLSNAATRESIRELVSHDVRILSERLTASPACQGIEKYVACQNGSDSQK